MDILIKGVRHTAGGAIADIAIDRGRIVAIEPNITVDAAEIIDAGGRAAIPGLLEPHIHLDKAFLHERHPSLTGTLEEAIRITGILKSRQEREDVLARSRRVLDMALMAGTTALRVHPDVDTLQHLIGVETALQLKQEYRGLLDLQIVAFPQEGILQSPGTFELVDEAMRLGADVVGGCPYSERSYEDSVRHIELVFDLAQKYGAPIDMHADFAGNTANPRMTMAAFIAQKTLDTGWRSRVTLGHVTSLAALTTEKAKPVIDLLHDADVHIVSLPATDIYLGGRDNDFNPRRGLTPIRHLRAAGVNVAYSSNNIRNAFTPFGKADPLMIGNLLAHIAQMGTPESQTEVLRMCTYDAARAMGIAQDYGIAVGRRADLVILDTYDVADALLDIPVRSWVIKDGRVTVTARHICEIHRS
jgi:cytosine/creatinine deaminase